MYDNSRMGLFLLWNTVHEISRVTQVCCLLRKIWKRACTEKKLNRIKKFYFCFQGNDGQQRPSSSSHPQNRNSVATYSSAGSELELLVPQIKPDQQVNHFFKSIFLSSCNIGNFLLRPVLCLLSNTEHHIVFCSYRPLKKLLFPGQY
jgi:hypothetical protein